MNDNIKFELAVEIINTMIAHACRNGFNPNDRLTRKFLREQADINKFNWSVIDRVIDTYGPMIKGGNYGGL